VQLAEGRSGQTTIALSGTYTARNATGGFVGTGTNSGRRWWLGERADIDAFARIVRHFQHMAFGFAYAILGEFHLAHDAAQEASIEAYRQLGSLRDPGAFPAWFRRIVLGSCNRLTRKKRLPTVPLSTAVGAPSAGMDPADAAERRELAERVMAAVRALPDEQRPVTTLYYVNGYSQREIAEFLELPVTTVNNRLHASRKRLREERTAMVGDTLRANAPEPEETGDCFTFLFKAAQRMSDGVPIIRLLALGAEEARTEALRGAILGVRAAVEEGSSIGQAMARHPDIFPAMAVWLVEVGEYLGELDVTARMAGQWLRDGEYETDPYAFTNASTYHLRRGLREAIADGATAVVIDSGRTSPLGDVKGRPEMVWLEREMPDGFREPIIHVTHPGDIGSYLTGLRMLTMLDEHQKGDELTGRLRIRLDPGDAEEVLLPISFGPYRGGEEVRIQIGR
jgi:RNA polymerase sigma factor (sigma-70 family)